MPTVVSRNTIKLAASASATNDYYKGYTLVLSRYNSVTGKQLVQTKEIIKYDGTAKIATIDGIWDADFIPDITDTYKIVPTYPDNRVSINPAIQTLDYITSERYGKGLKPERDLFMPSWTEAARTCDTQSDVTVQFTGDISSVAIDSVFEYRAAGILIFQGKVKSKTAPYITFTSVLGKLTNKWNSWKGYKLNEYVYDEARLYKVTTAGTKATRPTHTTGTVGGLAFEGTAITLTKLSGTGPATLTTVIDGNPVRSVNAAGTVISGYSLYDSDGIDYWRYVGWDEHSQRSVTRHQTNLIIDTSISLFDNINSLLEHFGGILRYTSGQYHLEVEQGEGVIPNADSEPRNISADHIIGKIRATDEGLRSSFNSLTIAYADPGNKFEAKNISFFNSEFLKTDRNVPKKGNMSIPGVTNYYNARILADKFLVKSRYGLTVSFNMSPRGALLLAGRVIQIQHPKYGWADKKFRITNITHNTDTSVDIVAKEYDDSMYLISNISRPPATALAGESNTTTNIKPVGLTATSIDGEDETIGGIELNWENSPAADSTVATELFGSFKSNLYITVINIAGATLTSSVAHQLVVGDIVTSQAGTKGFIFGKTYYVKTVPTTTTFTLAETASGASITFPENGSGLSLRLLTANIITTVAPPTTSYIDVIPGQGSARIQKYYWIRHKISQG